MVIDPYTHELIGQKETQIATVTVTRVEAKMAYATVVTGDSTAIEPGFIARAAKMVSGAAPPRQKPVGDKLIVPKAGGVIL